MITAKEANKQTNEIRKKQIDKAKELAKREFESFIEPKIKEAISYGKYSISFTWESNKFKELPVDHNDFTNAIIELCDELGYAANIDSVTSIGYFVKAIVYIEWRK